MKTDLRRNLLVLTGCLLSTIGLGGYITFVRQPVELERVVQAEQLTRLKQAEVTSLLAEVASSQEMADDAVRKWNARYKYMPNTLSSAEVVGYLNTLTQSGFDLFDIEVEGTQRRSDYNFHTLHVTGRGYYVNLYRFIWDIENNRDFYRIRDLTLDHMDLVEDDAETGNPRMQIMVSFDLYLDAYFGGPEGMSAPQMMMVGIEGEPVALPSNLPPVPMDVLPSQRPALNPFFPIVMEELPPNTYNLVDVETAELIAIADNEAVFSDDQGYRKLAVGGDVYLGQIVSIDPREERVVARLNKGGIIDEVTLELHSGERYRKALGPVQLAPAIVE
jgi:hypothetical protein